MKTIADLNDNTKHWFIKSMNWMDNLWDEGMSLCKSPVDVKYQHRNEVHHTVRNTVWYATGLLMRQAEGDVDRAIQAITAVMTYQFDEPETVYHGTFYRSPRESHPPENPTVWDDYDPNWREFICTVFIILLDEFDELLPSDLQDKMLHSILLASQGSYARKVDAEYTNISLMSAFLLDFAGNKFDNSEWVDYALEQAHLINDLFHRNNTFNEYNSPTYYGIDFYALALWRKYGSTQTYQSMGATMETVLWRDTAQFYHADMKNICGAYDRSYGMDMTDYLAAVGLWIAAALPPELAPLPDVDQPFNHPGDFFFMPMVALVDTLPPDDVLPHFNTFQGELILERVIEPQRGLTAWLSDTLMLGAEADNLNPARSDQFHPATAHWKTSDNTIAWIKTRSASLIQATAKPYELRLSSGEKTEYVFQIDVPNASPDMITASQWTLPDMTVNLQRPDTPFKVRQEDNSLVIQFASEEDVILTFKQ